MGLIKKCMCRYETKMYRYAGMKQTCTKICRYETKFFQERRVCSNIFHGDVCKLWPLLSPSLTTETLGMCIMMKWIIFYMICSLLECHITYVDITLQQLTHKSDNIAMKRYKILTNATKCKNTSQWENSKPFTTEDIISSHSKWKVIPTGLDLCHAEILLQSWNLVHK